MTLQYLADVAHLTRDDLLNIVDLAAARELYSHPRHGWNQAPNNCLTPWPHGHAPIGSWCLDPVMGFFYVLILVDPFEIEPNEGDWEDVRRRADYRLYVEWFRQGIIPPPVHTCREASKGLCVLTSSRRRTLAAREAGVKLLPAWHTEARPDDWYAWQIKRLGSAWQAGVALHGPEYLRDGSDEQSLVVEEVGSR